MALYLKYRFLSFFCNLKFLNNKLFNLQYIANILQYVSNYQSGANSTDALSYKFKLFIHY